MWTRTGLSVIEMIAVLAIVTAMASIALPLLTNVQSTAAVATTRSTLSQTRDAIALYWSDTKSIPLDGVLTHATELQRFQVRWLFRSPLTNSVDNDFNPASRIGWNGPYLLQSTGDVEVWGVDSLIDAWNHPITIQDVDPTSPLRDLRVVSAGPNGIVDIPTATPSVSLTELEIGDDLYVALLLQ